jgi:predicted DNA-binding transcriptional regulator AlpA
MIPSQMTAASPRVERLVLNARATAKLLGIGLCVLAKWRKTGEGPDFIRLGARRIAYHPDDIQRWLAANRVARVASRRRAAR